MQPFPNTISPPARVRGSRRGAAAVTPVPSSSLASQVVGAAADGGPDGRASAVRMAHAARRAPPPASPYSRVPRLVAFLSAAVWRATASLLPVEQFSESSN